MGQIIDMTGQVCGRLTVIELSDKRTARNRLWRCECPCGNIVYASANSLRRGHTRSCGCLARETLSKRSRLDIAGLVFGRLTAESSTDKRIGGSVAWRCRCSCGNVVYVRVAQLRNGNTKSCGCLNKEIVSQRSRVDITGLVFGRLTAEEPTDKRAGREVIWRCKCSCGNVVYVRGAGLRNGNTKSCGCLQREAASQRIRRDITGLVSGKLTAIAPTDKRTANNGVIWRCKCACGNECYASTKAISRGDKISCGCARHDETVYLSQERRAESAARCHKRRARIRGNGGSYTVEEERRVYKMQRGRCFNYARCGNRLGKHYHREHIIAVTNGGTSYIRNIQLSCEPCNLAKSDMDPIDWARGQGLLC